MSDKYERSRKLQDDMNAANDELESIEQRLTECRHRLRDLCQVGPRPAFEAVEELERDVDRLAEEGRRILHNEIHEFTRPRHNNPSLLKNPVRVAPSLHSVFIHRRIDRGGDHHPVFVYLMRDAVLAEAKAAIEEKCQGTEIPAEDERCEEIKQIGVEVKSLEKRRDKLRDKVSFLVRQLRAVLDATERGVHIRSGDHAA